MYNRYVAQEDGSFQKQKLSEPESSSQADFGPVFQEAAPSYEPVGDFRRAAPMQIGRFLKNLLPANLDTEDLIIILLLLLMGEGKQGDSNQAMLTLAAYLFL